MDIDAKLIEIRAVLVENSSAAIAEKYRKYFVEGYDPYGVDASITVGLAKSLIGSGINMDEAMALSGKLVASGKYEEGSLAISLISRMQDSFSGKTLDAISRWFEVGIRNWAHVDGLAGSVLSALLNMKIATLEEITKWESSPYKYQRRAVPVSLIATVGKTFSVKQVIDATDPLMMDEEKVVHQAMGWLLREIWKKEPGPVEEQLSKYRLTGPRIIFQYATEKMTPEQKQKFRRKQ